MSLISCEISLTLTWYNNCVLIDLTTQDAAPAQGDNPTRSVIAAPTNAASAITDCKLYVKDLKEQSNGIDIDQKCVIRLEITI